VPWKTNPPVRRALALAACLGLALTGCSVKQDSNASSPSKTPSSTSTVKVPAGVKITAAGSRLDFGSPASVQYSATQTRGTALKLTVDKVQKGSLRDFKGFILDDKYKRQASYYYVNVTVQNLGKQDIGGIPVPLWGVDDKNVLLPAVNFTTAFNKCPSKPLPSSFGPGDSVHTCLVYLAPNHGTLKAVSFRPDQKFNPITWTGQITTPSPGPKKSKKHG
jgi:hypothetical protein